MVSEHIVLGPSAGEAGLMANPREYALPGNQDPATPWPSSLVLLSGIAAATTRLRLVAGAVIPPLRHPLLLARELGSLDLLAEGRLVVLPTVSWHREEYEALGVPFGARGDLLDEHLAAWEVLWRDTPGVVRGRALPLLRRLLRAEGLPARRPGALVRRQLGARPAAAPARPLRRRASTRSARRATDELARLRAALVEAGRAPDALELVGGIRGTFPDAAAVADLPRALESIPGQLARGYTSICFKPSQYTDDLEAIGPLCRELVRRVAT